MPLHLSVDELTFALAAYCLDDVPDVSQWMEDDDPEHSCDPASKKDHPPRP